MPDSVTYFKTRGFVRVKGTIDGLPFQASFMALGDGTHMVPVRAALRIALTKEEGDPVTVHLRERVERSSKESSF